jgi:hypothetical protein
MFLVSRTERGALSISLSILLVLFLLQFFLGMTMNLLMTLPTDVFPKEGGSFVDGIVYSGSGGNLFLTSHFLIDLGIIAVGIANVVLVIHKSNVYKVLSVVSLIVVLSAFVNGARFVASNFSIDDISFGMAAGFMLAFLLYFIMAMLMYRDLAVASNP